MRSGDPAARGRARSRRSGFIAAALIALALVSACRHSEGTVRLGSASLRPLVADSRSERLEGLQGHSSADVARGMLFVWPDEAARQFEIKGVVHPLDLLFLDKDGVVLEIGALSPQGPTRAGCAGAVHYVLEVRAGWVAAHDVRVGDRASITLDR